MALGIALADQGSLARSAHPLSPSAVQRLIELMAPITGRRAGSRSGIVTAGDDREMSVRGLFNQLAADTSTQARDALGALAESNQLGGWHEDAVYSAIAQQSAAREASFRPADPKHVAQVINNAGPANPADLLALTMQHLVDIEADLRHDNSFLVRQFWQKCGDGWVPQHEEYCRDLLKDRLQTRLNPLNIAVGREESKADDKRVDMSVSFMRTGKHISVPIEVKKEDDRKIWSAWRDQLQRLYTNDPSAGGYGLYLVLWFGHKPPKYQGIRPNSAGELLEMLEVLISERDRYKLRVQVLDLSMPP